MTRVRSRRSSVVHVSTDLRRTFCNRKVDAWVIEPDNDITCERCLIIARDCDRETGFN
jgi:hypothetical protein